MQDTRYKRLATNKMNGILIVDKPQGITSHDIVDFIRKRFLIKKVGHAGTLDPEATGVLVLLLGSFTRRSSEFSSCDKEYEASLTLGLSTDTQDAKGRIIKQQEVASLDLKQIEQTFGQFLGEIEQTPPMFAALRYKGQRLYKLARKGIEVKRRSRRVFIYKIKITNLALPHIYFVVKCSKGTYIRTLCSDIAEGLGYPGYMSGLRRIKSGSFDIKQAITLDNLRHFSVQQLRQALLQDEIN